MARAVGLDAALEANVACCLEGDGAVGQWHGRCSARADDPRKSGCELKGWVGTAAFGIVCAATAFAASAALKRPPPPASTVVPDPRPANCQEGGPRVHVSPDFETRFGVQTVTVAPRSLAPAIDLVGSVDFDADHVADVGARIRGRVTRVLAGAGAAVHVGTPLVELESVSLGEVTATLTAARAEAAEARARLARETDLFREHLTTIAAVQNARADFARAEAQAQGARQRLAAMGANAAGGRRVILRSPIAGHVIRRSVIVGQTIDDTDEVMRVADLTHVWVLLDVFERDLAHVRVGDHAEITTEAYPDRNFDGAVSLVDSTIDMRTRTARVRIEVDNPDLSLRPGEFVTARLRMSSLGSHEVTAIPREAVVQLDGRPAVFVRRAPLEYEAAVVALGAVDGDDVEIVRGLSVGDVVVTRGAFALKSELLR
jgi:cobalt-zinc-cadmium efflux system membrane fusion protein